MENCFVHHSILIKNDTNRESFTYIFGAGGNNVIGIVSANNNPDNYQLICHPHFSECYQILLSLDGYYFIYYKRYLFPMDYGPCWSAATLIYKNTF